MALHDEVLRAAVAALGGTIFSTGGDGCAAVFARAASAVEAAVAGQVELAATPWPGDVALRVQMGLHTGEAQERGGNYFGPAAARVVGR